MAVDIPQTVWRDTNGLTEYSNEGVNNISDPSGNLLVDPSGNFIVDTGIMATLIPSTIWEELDNV